jgi:hypothetical protein
VGFEEFLTARLPTLLRFATALVGDPHRAEDVVQGRADPGATLGRVAAGVSVGAVDDACSWPDR